MKRSTIGRVLHKKLVFCSIVAVVALLLFSCAASAFTYSSNDYSVSPTGTVTPGTSVTASMTVSYSDGTQIPTQLNLDSDLAGVSWTVVKNPGTANALTSHPTYPYDYVSNFDLYESSGSVTLKITVTGTVSSDSAGESIHPLIISESGGSGTVYTSPSLAVAGSSATLTPTAAVSVATAVATSTPTPTTVILPSSAVATTTPTPTTVVSTATTVATVSPTQTFAAPTIATKTPHPTLSQPTSSPSASKSTFDSTALIIIISALVVIVVGTVIIVRLTKRPKKEGKVAITKVEQKEIHVHVNGNVYSDVGVVASDNAIVNRATVTNEPKKKCPYCGAELNNDDKFCSKCGKQL